jgi:hypothetical protein
MVLPLTPEHSGEAELGRAWTAMLAMFKIRASENCMMKIGNSVWKERKNESIVRTTEGQDEENGLKICDRGSPNPVEATEILRRS